MQAAIVPPPEPHILEFGVASWVKATRTQTHNNNNVELRDLISDDPDDPNDRNWMNNEPDEVEVEYALAKAYWGQGIATEAARASVGFGFDTLKLPRIIALAWRSIWPGENASNIHACASG